MTSETPDRKLNIAMVCDAVTDYVGGCLTSTNRFSELLVARGHKVIFITGRSPKNPQNGWHGPIEVFRFRGLPAPFFEGEFYLGFPSRSEIEALLREHNIDVVHIQLPLPSGIPALRAAQALGVPVVMHSHTQPENVFLNVPRFIPTDWLNRLFYRYMHWFYAQGQIILFPSAFSRARFSELAERCNTRVLSNGVNTEVFRPLAPDALFEKFGLPRGRRNLLFVGRLHPEKNVETLIRAVPGIVAAHADAHVFIVGHGHQAPLLQRLARETGVAEHVTFFGRLSDEDLLLAYNACELYVLPSLAELEGVAVLEAMACGKPLLIANSPDSASVHLVQDNGLLFRPKDPADLAAQANRLLADPDLLRAMGERSRSYSRRYDIMESAAELESIYYGLVRREPRAAATEAAAAPMPRMLEGQRS
jgi:glycosyltransferase involved in cell wall biosynthesis